LKVRFLILCLFTVGAVLSGCSSGSQPTIKPEKIREYANELYNRQLFEQALEQYRFYLNNYALDEKEQANITYQIANIYFDRLKDYDNALAEFLKIRTLYPESPLLSEVNKKVVACLERMQRPEDAQQALNESTSLEGFVRESRPGEVIARIGDRSITQGDLDFEISQLPPEVRAQFLRKENRIEFLRRYIATELMYDSAKRQGLDQDKDVLENSFQAKRSFMVQKLLEQEISKKVQIDPNDVQLYYEAHKDDFAEKDEDGNVKRVPPLQEINSQVAQRLFQERYQVAYEELISSLLRAEGVHIYDDLVK
jgi:hypothetical protein